MPVISNIQTWQEYCQVYKRFRRGDISFRNQESISVELRKLYELEKPLTPSDMSHQLLRELFIVSAGRFARSFDVDRNNEKVIDLFIQYLRRDEQFLKQDPSYRFGKGLFLRGSVGSGKTLLFKALHDLKGQLRFFSINNDHESFSDPDNFSCISSNDIIRRFSLDGYLIFQETFLDRKTDYIDLINKPLMIDDIGSEPEGFHYGAKLNVISEVIQQRYEKGRITHATSNLGTDALEKAYGLRVFDRMKEMFNDITLTGASRRN